MQALDWNLLPALHALLHEENVTRAAHRLHLSVAATSRTLTRCRKAFDDPLLVRRGRGVVMTPRARALIEPIDEIVRLVGDLLEPPDELDPASLQATFAIRCNEAVIAAVGRPLLALVAGQAPGVRLRFEAEAVDDLACVATGAVALAIGSYGDVTAELRTEPLGREHLVGVVRAGHPARQRRLTLARLAALEHVVVSRRGNARGPIDDLLLAAGHRRRVVAIVPTFSAALALCADSDCFTIAPRRLADVFAGPAELRQVDLPVELPAVEVVQVWHGRDDHDQAHRWLRRCVAGAVASLRADEH